MLLFQEVKDAFRTALLDELKSRIGPSFKKTKSACYSDHKDGFYIYAKPNKCDPQTVAKYIGRYLGRPVIATSRIDSYDGLYARHCETDKQLRPAVPKEKQSILRSFTQWRTAILSSFGYDPLVCPECGHKMEFLELYYNHKRVSLEELYGKVMSRSRRKRSSS